MTIAAAYLTSEGVVFGADSTTTVSSNKKVSQLLNHAQKVFEIGENSRLGICTWGAGCINGISHRTLIARLGDELDIDKVSVSCAVDAFKAIVAKEFGNGKNVGFIGYALGGWDVDSHIPQCFEIQFQPESEIVVSQLPIGEARFFGHPEFFARVFHGFDSKLPDNLLSELKKQKLGIKDDDIEAMFADAFQKAIVPLRTFSFSDLPVREAIDFVHTYLHITIKSFKFRSGPPICGGPIEIGFISSDRNFRWVRHKAFDRAINEQEAW